MKNKISVVIFLLVVLFLLNGCSFDKNKFLGTWIKEGDSTQLIITQNEGSFYVQLSSVTVLTDYNKYPGKYDSSSHKINVKTTGQPFDISYLQNNNHLQLSNSTREFEKASPANQSNYYNIKGKNAYEFAIAMSDSFSVPNYKEMAKDYFTTAGGNYSLAIQLNRKNESAIENRAALYARIGKTDSAIADYIAALKINPTNAEIYSDLGLVYWQKGFDDKSKTEELDAKAMNLINKAIQMNPNLSSAYVSRGSVLASMQKKDEAINDFTKAIEVDSKSGKAYYNRGITHYNIGDKEKACIDLKKAADLGYRRAANAVKDLCK